jgi:hypothetical protein
MATFQQETGVVVYTHCMTASSPRGPEASLLVEQGVAYQWELVNGEIVTGSWNGVTDGYGNLEMRNVDTGERRMVGASNVKWFDRLDWIAAQQTREQEQN